MNDNFNWLYCTDLFHHPTIKRTSKKQKIKLNKKTFHNNIKAFILYMYIYSVILRVVYFANFMDKYWFVNISIYNCQADCWNMELLIILQCRPQTMMSFKVIASCFEICKNSCREIKLYGLIREIYSRWKTVLYGSWQTGLISRIMLDLAIKAGSIKEREQQRVNDTISKLNWFNNFWLSFLPLSF